MNKFILAITTYNRIAYLRRCVESWESTKTLKHEWKLIVADDGSSDKTVTYLKQLKIKNVDIILIENKRIGVHQQVNTILNKLEMLEFDMCFKIDDDITFLKKGWDNLYYFTASHSGFDHLVFCDDNWCEEQKNNIQVVKNNLVGKVNLMQAHGCFYTITPKILSKVGYMDAKLFGFRGMGHVDFTMRCARAGFTSEKTPWDIGTSNDYISASQKEYKSVIPSVPIAAYDDYNRKIKEKVISKKDRVFIPYMETNLTIFNSFQNELVLVLTKKVENYEIKKEEEINWYKTETKKIKSWYESQYGHLPFWFVKVGKIFKLLK